MAHLCMKEITWKIPTLGEDTIAFLKTQSFLISQRLQAKYWMLWIQENITHRIHEIGKKILLIVYMKLERKYYCCYYKQIFGERKQTLFTVQIQR